MQSVDEKGGNNGLSSHENQCELREIILSCVDTYISGKPWKNINVIICRKSPSNTGLKVML